jgi:hypothetical protein
MYISPKSCRELGLTAVLEIGSLNLRAGMAGC